MHKLYKYLHKLNKYILIRNGGYLDLTIQKKFCLQLNVCKQNFLYREFLSSILQYQYEFCFSLLFCYTIFCNLSFLFLWNHNRCSDAGEQYEKDNDERSYCIYLEEIVDEHLHTDEHQ